MSEIIVTRRGFLQIASAAIAMPIIARAAILPELVVPGITRIRDVSREKLIEGHARFADAVFAPGPNWAAINVIEQRAWLALPHGSSYEVRAVPLPRDEMLARAGYKRDGVAMIWTSDAGMQSRHWKPEDVAHARLVKKGITGQREAFETRGYIAVDWPEETRT